MSNAGQLAMEDLQPKPKFEYVKTVDLPDNSSLGGAEPDSNTRQSIALLGVLEPVILEIDAEGNYIVVEGIRRIKSARYGNRSVVPAMIYNKGEINKDIVGLATNIHRKSNPLAELEKIENLRNSGISYESITKQASLTQTEMSTRLRLGKLEPELREAYKNNKIKPTVADRASRLPQHQQKRLVDTLIKKGKIKGQDVIEVRRVGAVEATGELSESLFNNKDFGELTDNWVQIASDGIWEILNLCEGKKDSMSKDEQKKYLAVYNCLRGALHHLNKDD